MTLERERGRYIYIERERKRERERVRRKREKEREREREREKERKDAMARQTAAAKIRSEMMRVGEPGPSPRLRERTASKDVASFKRCFDALDTLVADKASDGVPTTASGHMWPQLDVTSSLG